MISQSYSCQYAGTSGDQYPSPQGHAPVVQTAAESREDFGRIVRRIMYSNSGQFRALATTSKLTPVNRDWDDCKRLAQEAERTGNFARAEFMWLAALNEAKSFEMGDRRLLITLESLAGLYLSIGRYDQAESFSIKAIETARQNFGNDNLVVASFLNNLAGIYYCQHRYNDAEPICRRLLVLYEKALGPDHDDVGVAANNLAMLYHAQGKLKLAERLYLRAIEIRTKTAMPGDPEVRSMLENYANLLSITGREEVAQQVRRHARGSFVQLPVVPPAPMTFIA